MSTARSFLALLLVVLLLGACQQVAAPTVPAPAPPTTSQAAPTTAPAPTIVPTAATAPTPATAGQTAGMSTKMVKFASKALAGNLLGDPNTRSLVVLLPRGYDASTQRYPVVYVLHDWGGSVYDLVRPFKTSFEKVRPTGEVQDMIFVFIDGSNKLGGSWYYDSPTTGGYETYISREIVDYVDANFRTLATPASRGIAGCSMGGDGAAHLGLAHPDIFGIIGSVSAPYDWGEPGWTEMGEGYTEAKSIADFKVYPWTVQLGVSRAAAVAPNRLATEVD